MEPLEPEDVLPYIIHTIAYNNSDSAAVYHNLQKAWRFFGVISKVLKKTGATVTALGMIYKVVVQTFLVYGSDSRVMT